MKNIALILLDQIRTDMLGVYDHKIVKTPSLDIISKDGVRFDRAYTPAAVCCPARTSLFTGSMPTNHGILRNAEKGGNTDIKLDDPNITTSLKNYSNLYIGKWHVGNKILPKDFGFKGHNFDGYGYPGSKLYKNMVFDQGPKLEDRYKIWLKEKGFEIPHLTNSYFGENPNLKVQELYGQLHCPKEATLPYFVVEEAIEAIKKSKENNQPFFIWLNFWGPHTPCTIPEPYYSMYDPKDVILDESFYNALKDKPKYFEYISKMWGVWEASEEEWKNIITKYWGYTTLIDEAIGVFIDFLKKEGLYESIFLAVTADHGDAMSSHKLIEKGEFMLDSTYRIPMIIKDPESNRKGEIEKNFVYLHDLTSTITDFTGGVISETFDGKSILPLLRNKKEILNKSWRDGVLCQLSGHFVSFEQRMWREEKFKIVFNATDICELYDMENDPLEINNLFYQDEFKDIKKRLLNKLACEMKKINDPLFEWFRRIKDTL